MPDLRVNVTKITLRNASIDNLLALECEVDSGEGRNDALKRLAGDSWLVY